MDTLSCNFSYDIKIYKMMKISRNTSIFLTYTSGLALSAATESFPAPKQELLRLSRWLRQQNRTHFLFRQFDIGLDILDVINVENKTEKESNNALITFQTNIFELRRDSLTRVG